MPALKVSAVENNLNLFNGNTIIGGTFKDDVVTLDTVTPNGNGATFDLAKIFGLKAKDVSKAIVAINAFTLKSGEHTPEMTFDIDKVAGAVIRKVNVYVSKKGTFSNRLSFSILADIPGTKLSPGLMTTIDFSSDYPLI